MGDNGGGGVSVVVMLIVVVLTYVCMVLIPCRPAELEMSPSSFFRDSDVLGPLVKLHFLLRGGEDGE